ncbi:unnamed protein product [Trichogramma brassicae]|uniref:Uncharacterized protein n=1 Tax=Trichogramma brassicae TaxID=86971 RepID=A0A6H5IFI7_9HYME|nr:unnamed protein product [Trichogramma brassicae]
MYVCGRTLTCAISFVRAHTSVCFGIRMRLHINTYRWIRVRTHISVCFGIRMRLYINTCRWIRVRIHFISGNLIFEMEKNLVEAEETDRERETRKTPWRRERRARRRTTPPRRRAASPRTARRRPGAAS